MDEHVKALLLLCGAGLDARAWTTLKQLQMPPSVLWTASDEALSMLPATGGALARIRALAAAGWAEKEFEACRRRGVKLVFYGASDYPQALFDLQMPPAVLYWSGAAPTAPEKTVGIVGTRKCSSYGRNVAAALGNECARHHAAVISGGAQGVDGAAHSGACEAGGVTLAVLGTGVDVVFPQQNFRLFENIRQAGALISEFPLGAAGEPWHFPRRNRIVAALSKRLVVVEAPAKSGALITARQALDLGREVWAVPGRISDAVSDGSNRLIFDGAYPFISMEAFFGSQPAQGSLFAEGPVLVAQKAEDFPPGEASVMTALWNSGGRTVDNLALEVKMSAADVLKIIAVLSAKGVIYLSGPGRYSAKV